MAKKISYHQALTMQALGIKVTPRVYPNNYVVSVESDNGVDILVLAIPVRQVDPYGITSWTSYVSLSDYLKSIKWLRV